MSKYHNHLFFHPPNPPAIYSSVQFSHSVVSDSLQTHGLQHARLPCPSLTPGAYSNSCPSSQNWMSKVRGQFYTIYRDHFPGHKERQRRTEEQMGIIQHNCENERKEKLNTWTILKDLSQLSFHLRIGVKFRQKIGLTYI